LPIADCQLPIEMAANFFKLAIGNQQSAMTWG